MNSTNTISAKADITLINYVDTVGALTPQRGRENVLHTSKQLIATIEKRLDDPSYKMPTHCKASQNYS